jgi:hypothetical protein
VTTAVTVDGTPCVIDCGDAEIASEAGTASSVSDAVFEIVALVDDAFTSTVTVPTLRTEPPAFIAAYVVTVNEVFPTGAVTVPLHESDPPEPVHPLTPAPMLMTVGVCAGAPVTTGTIETDIVAGETYRGRRSADDDGAAEPVVTVKTTLAVCAGAGVAVAYVGTGVPTAELQPAANVASANAQSGAAVRTRALM